MKKLMTGFALAAFSVFAQAQVVNGGFEDGGLQGWTQTRNASPAPTGVTPSVLGSSEHYYSTGLYLAAAGTAPATVDKGSFLTQQIQTAANTFYTFSFDYSGILNPGGGDSNYLKVMFGNQTLFEDNNFQKNVPTTVTYNGLLAGTGGNVLLSFAASSIKSYVHLDNIVMEVSAVPEPETYAMLLAGLCLIGYSLQRRRQA